MRFHTGDHIPQRLIDTVNRWDQTQVTPGWIASLPATIADLCATWKITIDQIVPETYVTCVVLGQSTDLGPVVIKSSPLADEFRAEATALQLAASPNVARLYDVDLDRGAMVIERIVPGTQLREVAMSDDDATRLAAQTVATMWHDVPDPTGLHPLRQWMRELFNWSLASTLIAPELVAHAQQLATTLLAQSTTSRLLHGDFQHHNLLRRASGEWAIIDPKGVYGNPGFDIAAWMYNPPGVTARDDYLDLSSSRLDIFSDMWGIDRHELAAWAFVGSVLSLCWSVGDPAPDDWVRHFELGVQHLRKLV